MDMERPNRKHTERFNSRAVFVTLAGLGMLCTAVYLVNFKIYAFVPAFSGISGIELHVGMSLFLSALYLSAVVLVLKLAPKDQTCRSLTGLIILFGIIFRICLVPAEPSVLSKDMYRYIWDGRVQQAGINPYLYAPAVEELETLRDDRIFPNINRKDSPTVYPAGAQLYFRAVHAVVGDSVSGYKAFMVFFDIMTLFVLTALLGAHGFNSSRIIIYAWNPLAIFEIAYSGHLEGLMVFLMVSALYFYTLHRKTPGVIMLALAAAVKMYPALLLAAFLNRGHRAKGILTFCAALLLLYLPFMGAGGKISGFLPVYLKNPYESFNLGLKHFLMYLIPGLDYSLLSQLFIVILMIAGLVILLKEKEGPDLLRHAYILAGLLLILMPASLHPWYVILIIPYLVFYPSPGWLMFTCTVTLSYLKYVSPRAIMPTWVLLAEYLPLFTLLVAGFILKTYAYRNLPAALWGRKNEKPAEVR
jgi:alpha-1,6-mannosyltransferase